MIEANKDRFEFPVRYHKFHRNQLFNYQLNRWYSLGYADFEDLVDAGKKIKTFAEWNRIMLLLAEKAMDENMLLRAAFYYRAAEFYLLSDISEKELLYDKFNSIFYEAIKNDDVEKIEVPYQESFLPAMRVHPIGYKQGSIVMHGGFDSFIEEFYSMMKYFAEQGYEVIAFDGPGQGAARIKYGHALNLNWEEPVKVILDFFRLEDITLLGISMGGWLCLRAAAFETRIKRVIATGHAIDYMKSMNPILRWIHVWTMKNFRNFMERMAEKKFLRAKESIPVWMVKHLMYITKKDKPLDALETYLNMNSENIHSEFVKQDVFLLQGSEDHFIPLKMLKLQTDALINANSVTSRVFTKAEHAQNHCQVGNIGLSLDVMLKWIKKYP